MRGEQDASSAAFDPEIEQHYSRLRRLLIIQTRQMYARWNRPLGPEELEDEVSHLICSIVAAKKNFDPHRGCFMAWANTIALRRLADRQRDFLREGKRSRILHQASFASAEVFEGLMQQLAESRDARPSSDNRVELLMRELERLPFRQREAVRLRCLQEAEYPEIACQLGVSEAAARGLVCRGLECLGERVRSATRPDEPVIASGKTDKQLPAHSG